MGSEGGRREPPHAILSYETDAMKQVPPAPASAGTGKTSDKYADGKTQDGQLLYRERK